MGATVKYTPESFMGDSVEPVSCATFDDEPLSFPGLKSTCPVRGIRECVPAFIA